MNTVLNPAIVYYPTVGEILHNRYQLLQVISSGAFGQTYLAKDTLDPTRSHCAVKHYLASSHYPHLLKTSRRLYLSEATHLNQLGIHPQIPQLLDHFEQQHGFYLVQDYVEGMTLGQELALNRHNDPHERAAQVVFFLWDLLQILTFVHEHGVIHSDIKPNNVIRRSRDGKLVLLDFGAAQSVDTQLERDRAWVPFSSDPTQSTGYLAAEQLIGQAYPNSDLYAVGILAMQMLSGLDLHHLKVDAQTGELRPLQWMWTGTAPRYFHRLQGILTQMVRYNHQNRYRSSGQVLADLAEIREQVYPTLVPKDELLPLPIPTLVDVWADEAEEDEDEELWVNEIEQNLNIPAIDETAEVFLPESGVSHEMLDVLDAEEETAEVFRPESNVSDEMLDVLEAEEEEIESVTASPLSAVASPPLIPRATVVPLRQYQWQQPGWQTLARMGLVVGALNAFAITLGVHSLYQQAANDPGTETWQAAQTALEQGNLQRAVSLARTIPTHSSHYAEAQTAIAQWQDDWRNAATQVKVAQTAFQQQQWQGVLRAAAQLPDIPHWQQQVQPLVQQAQPKAEQQAKQLLTAAFRAAQQRDFTTALSYLYQIAPQTQVGTSIAPKLAEYHEKQGIRAMGQLQTAYNLAGQSRFTEAIAVLQDIPPNTRAGAIAQRKLSEYQQKAQLRAAVLARG